MTYNNSCAKLTMNHLLKFYHMTNLNISTRVPWPDNQQRLREVSGNYKNWYKLRVKIMLYPIATFQESNHKPKQQRRQGQCSSKGQRQKTTRFLTWQRIWVSLKFEF